MHPDVIKVFIGYDPVESVAWHTMAASIYRHSSRPVAIVPINLRNLKGIHNRVREPKQSNEFSISRFLVPYLCNYEGHAIFFDCDMMLRTDIAEMLQVIVLWNCNHANNRIITPEYVNTTEALTLHRFNWLNDEEIGELDVRWNWLVGEYDDPPNDVKNVHWTVGGPYFSEYAEADFSDEWFAEKALMEFCLQRKTSNATD